MKTINLLMAAVLVFSSIGCSSSKKQEATVEEKKVPEETQANRTVAPVALSADHLKLDMKEVKKRFEATDSIYASIKRTPCYGRCPIYEATIYKSGLVIYNGNRFVERLGKHKARLTKNQLSQIADKADAVRYFELENNYDSPAITVLKVAGKSKEVKNRVGGPENLKEYEKYLDDLLNGLTWTKVADGNQ
jgi:hypothetical protein